MKRYFHLGLRLFLQLGVLTGISNVKRRKDGNQWIQDLFSIYYYLILIITISSFIITTIGLMFTCSYILSEEDILLVLTALANTGGLLTWCLIVTFESIYARIYLKDFNSSIRSLHICVKKFPMSKSEGYKYLFIFLLYGCFNISHLLYTHAHDDLTHIHETTCFIVNILGNIFLLNFHFLFHYACLQLSEMFVSLNRIISKQLKNSEFYFFKNQEIKIINCERFLMKIAKYVLHLQKSTKKLFSYFELPISMTFICNIFYIICEITRTGTASASAADNRLTAGIQLPSVSSLFNVIMFVLLTIWIPDVLSKTVIY